MGRNETTLASHGFKSAFLKRSSVECPVYPLGHICDADELHEVTPKYAYRRLRAHRRAQHRLGVFLCRTA